MIKSSLISKISSVRKVLGMIADLKLEVSSNSRICNPESLFIALIGEKFNGHDFIEDVLKRGTKYVVVEETFPADKIKLLQEKYGVIFILVKDTLIFMQQLAGQHALTWLQEKTNRKIIGIAGSNGKTTHKEMISHLLKKAFPGKVIATEKNYNNHIGVPQTIFNLTDEVDIAVIEMGSNHPGELKTLCQMAHPNAGIISNIGKEHLEFFLNLDNVFAEERILYDEVQKNTEGQGIFVLDQSDPYLKKLGFTKGTITFSTDTSAKAHIMVDPGKVSIKYQNNFFELTNKFLVGDFNLRNLAASFLLCQSLFPEKCADFIEAAASFNPGFNRGSWAVLDSVKIFLDAYNSNPSSLAISTESFCHYCVSNKIALDRVLFIIGDMNELGMASALEHEVCGQKISSLGISAVAFIGKYTSFFVKGYGKKKGILIESTDIETFKQQYWKKISSDFTHVFLKGSRSLSLERLLDI